MPEELNPVIDNQLLEALDERAKAEGRSLSAVLDEAITSYLISGPTKGMRKQVREAHEEAIKHFDKVFKKLAD